MDDPTPHAEHAPLNGAADHLPVIDVPISTSGTTSFIDEPRSITPLPGPNAPFLSNRESVASNADFTPGESFKGNTLYPSGSQSPLDPSSAAPEPYDPYDVRSKEEDVFEPSVAKPTKGNKRVLLLSAAAGLIIVIAAVVLGVYFGVIRKNNSSSTTSAGGSGSSSSSSGPKPTGTSGPASAVVYGGDGTQVTTDQGNTFTYSNKFGGYFVHDPSNPFNNGARAQSWSPALNETWEYGKDKILGVNLGGWLVLEPFITPTIYQKYPGAIDEWTLHTLMAADTAGGGLKQLEDHYNTFITEEDFAQIAGAGLNWVRLPIPFWAIDTWEGEPFLPKVCWKYALKAFDWARKYGIRILLDLHSTPGSQNGYNHSGQSNKVNLLNGVMGIANAQRLLHYIRIFTEFIAQPQYKDVIPMFGIVNEPTGMEFGPLNNFYLEAHRIIRNITGVGAGHGPYISIQGGNNPLLKDFVGSDRIAVEQHPYFAFDGAGAEDVVPYIPRPCSAWAGMMDDSQRTFGFTSAAEFSLGFNDCGFMLHSVADEHTTADCTRWDEWENYTQTQKDNLLSFAMSNFDALQNWFFWTWKIGPNVAANSPRSPLWSYKLGLDNGWIPKNPRDAIGHCTSLGIAQPAPFSAYQPWQTGGGTGVINDADQAQYGTWPPTSIGDIPNATLLPTYTATGPIPTLPTQTYPAPTAQATFDGGDGWFDDADTIPGITTVAGCTYPNAWDATGLPVPAAVCTGTPVRRREPAPLPIITQM